jgi:hypothetical protein
VELSGERTFVWNWDGDALVEEYYFDLRIWSEKEQNQPKDLKRGAVTPIKGTRAKVGLSGVPAIDDYGTGTYYWTVVVVHKRCPDCDPTIAGEWGQERMFTYTRPSAGGGDDSDDQPTPRP